MPVNDTTATRLYPKPHPTNTLAYDVARLRDAMAATYDLPAEFIAMLAG